MQQFREQKSMNKKLSQSRDEEIRRQNIPFKYQKDTYYIPVYPRAFVQEVVSIDSERRTVTAKFVLFVTVCLKVGGGEQSKQLRKYLEQHLILQFGYNQIIFIPEHITLENSPFLITKMPKKVDEDYVTYRINGSIECAAFFDSMFFPFRRLEVLNHLCISSQPYRQWNTKTQQYEYYTIKYNIMMLLQNQASQIQQFLPYFGNRFFGDFKIDHNSVQSAADINPHILQKKINSLLVHSIYNVISSKKDENNIKSKEAGKRISIKQVYSLNSVQGEQLRGDIKEQLQPFKHIIFKFEMVSLNLAFILQQQVPIWILSIITLLLFFAQPNIGNKYSSVILLLVSYISIISNFRLNNSAQQVLTWFEMKLMAVTIVPILLIITTSIDYYNMDLFNKRANQTQNPFFIASLVIVVLSFSLTFVFLIFISLSRFICQPAMKFSESKSERIINWMNMVELQWGHNELRNKMIQMEKEDKNCFVYLDQDILEKIRNCQQHQLSPTKLKQTDSILIKNKRESFD